MNRNITIHEVKETDSTNSLAKKLAIEGARHLTVVWAHQQTSGRGRYGRKWISPPGNVFWSMILRPLSDWPSSAGLSHVAALAVHATISSLTDPQASVQIKWPNDVLVDGKKIAGILLEAHHAIANVDTIEKHDNQSAGWVIVGIGINVTHFPANVHFPATSLHAEGVIDRDRDQVMATLSRYFMAELNHYIEEGAPYLKKRLTPLMAGIGEEIRVRFSDNRDDDWVGVFSGLDDKGLLIVTEKNGEQRTVSTGEVFFGSSDS